MGSLVPGALTARRLHAGAIARVAGTTRLPRLNVPRAIMLAVAAVIIGAGVAALFLKASGSTELAWTSALLIKLAFGAAVAAVVTPIGLRAALVAQ
jgi:peptidoglycan/LPS O-acetylase OafA/YrhL